MTRVSKTFWQRQRAFLPSVVTLMAWRWRRQWLLLLVTGLGVLVAATLIASIPLFSSVMVTAGLRTTLRSTPDAARIAATVSLRAITSRGVTQATDQLDGVASKDLASYIDYTSGHDAQIRIDDWEVSGSKFIVNLYGALISEATSHLQVLEGTLPVTGGQSPTDLDGMLTQSAATYLGVGIGSTIPLQTLISTGVAQPFGPRPPSFQQVLQLHVVGIFRANSGDLYWNGNDFQASASVASGSAPFSVLVSSSELLSVLDTLANNHKVDGLFFRSPCMLSLAYTLDTARITGNQLDDLANQLGVFQADAAQQNASGSNFNLFFPYISNVTLQSPLLAGPSSPGQLGKFQNQVLLSMISVFVLAAQIAGLILFFVSVTASTLLERQTGEIALLRSRGASRQQVAGSLTIQSIGLCLAAAFPGPLLALGIVTLLAPHFLTTFDLDALNALPQSFAQLFSTTGLYVVGAVLVTLATLVFSLIAALRFDVQVLRRESARSTRRPLWLRLRLDLVVAVLALASYGYSIYIQNTQQLLDAQSQEFILTPLNLLAPFMFLLAGILFFLRLFPYLLHLVARLSLGGRGLSSPLALAQMERTPRQPMRMTLLLGLATAFALFTLVFSASQAQRAQDLASYEVGADFSGYLPATVQSSADLSSGMLARETALYAQIPGVTSASVGYVDRVFLQTNINSPDQTTRPVQLRAVDASTFAQTAYWSAQESSQSLADLVAQLAAQRSTALARGVVPAIVSSSAWQLLHLQAGATFQLLNDAGAPDSVRYLALAEVAHIPPANDSVESGMLVDFSTLVAARAKSQDSINLNYAWIRSSDVPEALTHVRQALTTQPLALEELVDRRSMAEQDAANPLALNVLGILSIGVIAALLLALLANLLLPLLSLRTRLTGFAILRALGTPPQQVARLLVWEQGIVLMASLLLGLCFGLLLAFVAVPPLTFTGVPVTSTNLSNADAVYLLQHLIPVQVVLPSSLLMALVVLVLLCILSLVLMLFLALRPLLGQILRINED
jgi:ABC-type antimicrobial peptide transport system permease subunit